MGRLRLSRSVSLAAVLLVTGSLSLMLFSPAPAVAQFGKNRVQYRDFDWKIYHSTHFNLYYYEAEKELLQKAASLAESAYDELSRAFDYQIQDPTVLIVYATHSAFLQNNIYVNGIPEGAQAFAVPTRFRMVLPLDIPDRELYGLIKHELTHIFQFHILFRGRLGAGLRGAPPTWFIEGMASYFADDEVAGDKKFLRDAVVNDSIPSVQAQGGGYFAYRFGHAVFEYIEERWGKEAILDLIYEFRNTLGGRIDRAFERAFRIDVEDFDAEFRRWLRRKYLTELVETGEPGDFGRPFRLNTDRAGQELSPVASPSGDLVAAITTDKGEVDISIFDARRRRRLRNLTRGFNKQIRQITTRNVRRIGGDLAFSPDGNYIAAFAERGKSRSLILIDVLNGGLEKIIDMDIEQQLSPAWSPDGRTIAFAGNLHGEFDIFLIDLETLEITNLTDSDYFEATPAFSPDGRWLAYSVYIGETAQLFRLDLTDPSQRYQLTEGDYNNKEPVFSPSGNRIYFTSDRTGADNIFGLDLERGQVTQYTNAVTGCDRPTVLQREEGGERLVYTGYWKGRFDLYMTDVEEPVAEPEPIAISDTPSQLDALPRFEPDIEVTIDESNVDDRRGFKFFLDDAITYVGLDTNQIWVGRILLSFSDYLGDRRFLVNLAAIDAFSDFDVAYYDLGKRLQWGARLFDERIYAVLRNPVTGQGIVREEGIRRTGAQLIGIYPLSEKTRLEGRLGFIFRKIDVTFTVQDTTGNIVDAIFPTEDEYPQVELSWVRDSAIYSPWGAISGSRIRLTGSYAPDLDDSGTLTRTVYLDARKYFPVTRRSNFAFRFFGADSDGNVPDPFFVGGLDTIRGVDFRDFAGFRAFYGNAEFRFPLIDQLSTPWLQFQGIRGVIFVDLGAAYFPELSDFDFYDSDEERLEDVIASFGYGLTVRFLGLNLNWDFSQEFDLQDTSNGFRTSFWIGARF